MLWYTRKDQILRFVEWMKKTMFPKRKPQTRLVINLVLAWQFSRRAIPRGPRGFLSWRILTFPEFWLGIVEIPEKLLTISKQPSSPWPGFLGVARRDIPRQFLYTFSRQGWWQEVNTLLQRRNCSKCTSVFSDYLSINLFFFTLGNIIWLFAEAQYFN